MMVRDLEGLKAPMREALANREMLVVGVCGLSGAGKSTLCRQLIEELPVAAYRLDCDKFSAYSYVERERRIATALASGSHLEIDREQDPCNWYDWDGIRNALNELKARRAFSYLQGWNSKTGEKDQPYELVLPRDTPVLLFCDGIYLLHPPVVTWFDTRLLVDVPLQTTLERGRRRADGGDPRVADRMEALTRAYAVPYFGRHSQKADWVYSPDR